ncbi:hypothetical protein [Arsenicibacter rosenii]|uniref:Uncharacterized protein n=1 Tax=Arsenicibacter rosenii TaxID=1750698 RepID=A0A1S2VNQ0_9BACT|nr:hypothetical protein [Arsenicibacter rosenii]OIN59796.1 hypothetical protein BLX24_08030 [Arsenicibacter rosenii]
MRNDPVIFPLPVCEHVYKYLRVRLAGEPLLATFENAPVGTWLWALAQSEKVHLYQKHGGRVKRYRKYRLDEMSRNYVVGIYEFHTSRSQLLLNIAELQIFNRIVTKFMFDDLLGDIDARDPAVTVQRAIRNIADRYDFSDDDLSEASLEQLYYRTRAGRNRQSYRRPDWDSVMRTTIVGETAPAAPIIYAHE